MQKLLLPAVVVLLMLVVAALWWWCERADFGLPGEAPGASGTADAGVAVAAEGVHVPGANGEMVRVAVDAADSNGHLARGGDAPVLFGRVTDEQGAPLADATVYCLPSQSFPPAESEIGDGDPWDPEWLAGRAKQVLQQRVEANTAADGSFRLQPRGRSRRVDLRVVLAGYVVLGRGAQRPTEADVDVGTLVLPRCAIVSGRVVDRTGKAIVGAVVDRRSRDPGQDWEDFEYAGGFGMANLRVGDEATTDADGKFELRHVQPGEFRLRARHPEHPIARSDGLTATAGQDLADVLLVAEVGTAISGRVTGLPVERPHLRVLAIQRPDASPRDENNGFRFDAEMMFGGGSGHGERVVEVADDGSFTLRGLFPTKTYRVWAVQLGGVARNSTCTPRLEVLAGVQGVDLRFDPGVSVLCRVVDGRTGTPVERLQVDARLSGGDQGGMFWEEPRTARPRRYEGGVVAIANLRPKPKQTLAFAVAAPGYQRFERDKVSLPANGPLDLGTIRLVPVPVVDVLVKAGDGAPVADAVVTMREHRQARPGNARQERGETLGTGRTDAEGHCRINSVPGKQVVIRITASELAPLQSPVVELPKEGDHSFAAVLLRGGSVDVQVADSSDAAVGNARIEHRDPDGQTDSRDTDARGRVTFDHQQPGEHRFRLGRRDDPGSQGRPAPQTPGQNRDGLAELGWEVVEVVDGARASVALRKQPTAALAGVVRENGVPLAGARVAFQIGSGDVRGREQFEGGSGNSTQTDEQGRFVYKELPPGEHRLRIAHRTRTMPTVVPVVLRVGANSQDVELDVTVLRGMVRDPEGKPVAGASVGVAVVRVAPTGEEPPNWDGGRSTRTDTEGRFELRGVSSGLPLLVRASAKGFAPAVSPPLEVIAGRGRDDIELRLLIAGKIRVTVTGEGNGRWVWATRDDGSGSGNPQGWQPLNKGVAVLEGLQAGRWTVRLAGGAQEQQRTVELVAGETAEVRF